MKSIAVICAFFLALLAGAAMAEPARTEAEVQMELLGKLEADGFLSKKLAIEARVKYVDVRQLQAPGAVTTKAASADSLWTRYVNWLTLFKILGVILLLVAFAGTIRRIIKTISHVLASVPVEVFQIPMLAMSLYATCAPQTLWASQSFYVALFAAFANLILLVWVSLTHRHLLAALKKLFKAHFATVISFGAMLYFGALAVHYDSQLFGFFSAVSFSSMLSFGIYFSPGVVHLDFAPKALYAVVFGHLAVLALYVFLKVSGLAPASAAAFNTGIEYYCTVALCVGLLVGASPWRYMEQSRGLMLLLFVALFVVSITGYHFWDLKVIGSIVSCFFLLLMLEWLGKLGYSAGLVTGSLVLGLALFGAAMLMEKYGSFIVLSAT